ncbi:hypothetical protein NMG60_11018377 [Bertholletia excelsa]
MCSGSKCKLCPHNLTMEGKSQEQKKVTFSKSSVLLELSASDDLASFKFAVEDKGFCINEPSLWYGRRIGSKKMGFEERTPLMIASLYGSTEVLDYIIKTGKVDVNQASGSDQATALHCAAAGGSDFSIEIVKLLLNAFADVNSVDANGNKAKDFIVSSLKPSSNSRRKVLEMLLKGAKADEIEVEEPMNQVSQLKAVAEKKEYPIDVSLPDINTGIYSTDEFRMYSFKVKPCSRAYSHDWTECPFAHPGENAKRRDPRKYQYSCVPCPEFRKGTCGKGDACEYAHGVFESWLHPAQYKTRLCKDEIGCSRKVCFFAHKPEDLRPLYASTGSAMPSPKSPSVSSMDMSTLSPLALGSSSLLTPATSTPPMSPSVTCLSPMAGSVWQNRVNHTPSMPQLPSSRLKATSSARDLELQMELLELEGLRMEQQQRQQLIDEFTRLSSLSCWNNECGKIGDLVPANLDDVFGSTQLQSLTTSKTRQSLSKLRASYAANLSSSPAGKASNYGFDSSGAMATAAMNSRSAAFGKRSQSFIDRAAVSHHPGSLGLTSSANSASLMSSNLSDWNSPDGKLDWGFNGKELKKSSSFAFRASNATTAKSVMAPEALNEPDVSWVHSLVKDVSSVGAGPYSSEKKHGRLSETLPPWVDQLYIEQEQVVA